MKKEEALQGTLETDLSKIGSIPIDTPDKMAELKRLSR
jgi:hypothetical protein